MIINAWLALRDDAQTAINAYLDWDEESQGEYDGPLGDLEQKIFRSMADRDVVQGLFKKATINSNQWNLWSVPFDKPVGVLLKAKDALDRLSDRYPLQFVIGGAWHWDGRQVGTQFTYDENGTVTGISGTPIYPLHPKLIEFMPDGVLADVNLSAGQTPRQFT